MQRIFNILKPPVGLYFASDGALIITVLSQNSSIIYHSHQSTTVPDLHIYDYSSLLTTIKNFLDQNNLNNRGACIFLQAESMYQAVASIDSDLDNTITESLVIDRLALNTQTAYFCGIPRSLIFQYQLLTTMCSLTPRILSCSTTAQIYKAKHESNAVFNDIHSWGTLQNALLPFTTLNALKEGMQLVYEAY